MLKIFGLGHHTEEKHESGIVTEGMETESPVVVQSTRPPVSPLKSPLPKVSPNVRSSVARGPARPLRLVYCDEKGKFGMDPEAVAALQLVKGPVGAVAVCGRARQGKSFILNQVPFDLEFFGVISSVVEGRGKLFSSLRLLLSFIRQNHR